MSGEQMSIKYISNNATRASPLIGRHSILLKLNKKGLNGKMGIPD